VDYHVFKSALNRFYSPYVGGKNRPTYFDIPSTYPSLNLITENYPLIKNEFEKVYQTQTQMPLYHEIDPGETAISQTTDKNWKVFMLYLLGHKPEANRALCPETCRMLGRIPNLIQAFFSILEPGKSIPEHEGPYLGYLRYHLGIYVPLQNPPRLYVNSQEYIWQEGKAVLFDDSWPHSVKNESDDYRAVLIIDVLRPMPTLPNLLNKFVTGLIARYTYGRQVMDRLRGQKVNDEPVIK
jgi:aspartyl/asparaginyl beta-hydroxylase (cupin superfamily)